MRETYQADVAEVVYAGPHCVQPEIYEIEVKAEPGLGAPATYITLRFRPSDARFLAHLLQSNPPQVPDSGELLDRVAGHDT